MPLSRNSMASWNWATANMVKALFGEPSGAGNRAVAVGVSFHHRDHPGRRYPFSDAMDVVGKVVQVDLGTGREAH